jgi:hypothetical protein
VFVGDASDEWSKNFVSIREFCGALDAAGLRRTAGSSSAAIDESSVVQARRVGGLIYLKNTISSVLGNATSLISRVAQDRLRGSNPLLVNVGVDDALRTAYATMMELQGVASYNLAQENSKGSSSRQSHLRSSLECFRNGE